MSQLPEYVRATQFFKKKQREYGYKDTSNMLQNKWNMRDILDAMDDYDELVKLIQFFLLLSDDKSFKEFFKHYHSYYESMLETIHDRAVRKALREKTVKG